MTRRLGKRRPKTLKSGLVASEQLRLLRKWRGWLLRIEDELSDLLLRREIFVALRQIFDHTPAILAPSVLSDWMVRNYAEAVNIGIRRLCDTDRDVISLGRLLYELVEHPGVLTRDAHRKLCVDVRDPDAAFDELVGQRRHLLPAVQIRSELRKLEDVGERIKRMVDKRIAHATARRTIRRHPTYGHISAALDLLDRTVIRYNRLFGRLNLSTCTPVVSDWKRVLRFAWLPAAVQPGIAADGASPGS